MHNKATALQTLLKQEKPKVIVLLLEQKLRHNLTNAASLLDISPSRLRDLAQQGKISHAREGDGTKRKYFFTPEDLQNFVDTAQKIQAVI